MEIKFKKLRKDAHTPYKKYDVDAGFDLTAVWKEEKDKYIVYGTGIALEIPVGYVGLMFPRSSVTDQDLILKNCVGVIDASYRGEIMCRFTHNIHDMYEDEDDYVGEYYPDGKVINIKLLNRNMDKYEIGDRVCQIVFMKLPNVKMIESDELSNTERGTDGYGSSGK